MYGWLIAGLTALDLGIKSEIEREKEEEFPRELPHSGGKIKLYRTENRPVPGACRGVQQFV